MANGGDIGNVVPYEHKVLFVKERVTLLYSVVYSLIPHNTNNNSYESNTVTSFKSAWHNNYNGEQYWQIKFSCSKQC